ncbi:MAG: O-antigen ligase family protein [Anaerolineaceae bacterium]|nr:O-antigen ligase family protein [Anaerolineaceae bacterium]MDD4042024.1 O-antigen ligase family protein [Anaerolineaceae bacterium]MDD4577572.1 O-antigen ligase family protein [Anaerolineaceae bacterium]
MILPQLVTGIVWIILLLVMPISSFTPLSDLMGGTNVAPLAIIPAVIILVLCWLPVFFKGGRKLPYHFKPLLLFFLVGGLSTLLVSFRNVPTFQGFSMNRSIIETIITLAMGVGFYLVTIFMVKGEKELRSTIRWISIAGTIVIAISLLQVGTWSIFQRYPEWMHSLNRFLSSSRKLYEHRASGLAFEPSWLAHQLNILFIPLWLGLSISGQSVFKKKLFNNIQIEGLLLVLGIFTLFLTLSRVGWLTLFLLITYLVFRFANIWINKMTQSFRSDSTIGRGKQRLLQVAIWVGLLVGLLVLVFVAGVIMTRVEPRMADFFDIDRLRERGFLDWAAQLSLAERFMYWAAAYGVFQMFPIIGAGFGIPGFFFLHTVPDFGSQLLDINEIILTKFYLPNAKNLWARLLSETGIIGFALFVSWLVIHWRNANDLDKSTALGLFKAMGLFGKLVVLAMIIEGFSLDSFGLPYYWIALGLIAASWLIWSQDPVNAGANVEVTNANNARA